MNVSLFLRTEEAIQILIVHSKVVQGSDPHLQTLASQDFQVFPIINLQKLKVILREEHLKCPLRLGTFAAGLFLYSHPKKKSDMLNAGLKVWLNNSNIPTSSNGHSRLLSKKVAGIYLKANEAPAVRLLHANDSIVNFHRIFRFGLSVHLVISGAHLLAHTMSNSNSSSSGASPLSAPSARLTLPLNYFRGKLTVGD